MASITVYEKPTCTTCRKVNKLLSEKNISFDSVNYYIDPITPDKLKDLLKKAKSSPVDFLRKKEDAYKQHVAGKELTDEKLIALMCKYPDLIQRPIVEKGNKAILARPVDVLADFL